MEPDALVLVEAFQPLGQIVQFVQIDTLGRQPVEDGIAAGDFVRPAILVSGELISDPSGSSMTRELLNEERPQKPPETNVQPLPPPETDFFCLWSFMWSSPPSTGSGQGGVRKS